MGTWLKIGPILVILWPNSTRMGKKWAQVPLILTQFVENHLELNSNSSIPISKSENIPSFYIFISEIIFFYHFVITLTFITTELFSSKHVSNSSKFIEGEKLPSSSDWDGETRSSSLWDPRTRGSPIWDGESSSFVCVLEDKKVINWRAILK